MALIRSKRPDIFSVSSPPNLGPGSYDPNIPDFKPKNGVAPFGSTSERVTLETKYTPGPGEYDVPDVQATRMMMKPSSQFLSREHRMGRDANRGSDGPGPGAYTGELVKEYAPPKPARSLHAGSGINWVKVATAPSIPARTQSYGYKEGSFGELIQQGTPYQGHTGTGCDLPGPGYYNVSDKIIKKDVGTKGAIDFKKLSGRPAFHNAEKSSALPGPGCYDTDRAAQSHLLHGGVMAKKQTSAFSSTTNRAPLSTTSYGPGPGAYKPFSSFKSLREHLAANPDAFQAFGTSAANPRYEAAKLDVPGPGSYTGPLVPKPPIGDAAAPSAAFTSEVDRFHQPPSLGVGPGGYDNANPSFVDAVKSRLRGKFGAFGSTSARLPSPAPASAPPPGAYNAKIDINPSENRRSDKRSPAFRPSGTRDDPSHKTQGAATFYDVKIDWPKPSTLNPALAGTVPRFHVSKKDEVPGPGKYPTPQYLADKARTTTHSGPSVWPKANRFDRSVPDVPGPGAYNAAPESLVKKSFNITIGDTWE